MNRISHCHKLQDVVCFSGGLGSVPLHSYYRTFGKWQKSHRRNRNQLREAQPLSSATVADPCLVRSKVRTQGSFHITGPVSFFHLPQTPSFGELPFPPFTYVHTSCGAVQLIHILLHKSRSTIDTIRKLPPSSPGVP